MTELWAGFYRAFIEDNRYMIMFQGLANTLLLSLLAITAGIIIGLLVTIMKLSRFKLLHVIANIYVDIIRGTPSFVQMLIIYFVIFGSLDINKYVVGMIAFGINSGAYVSEIFRAGILSIDHGQTEAGRSLGLSNRQTMVFIVLPQAVKNVLPALCNEFIMLIKETAVAGYMAMTELTKSAMLITSVTYDYAWPMLGAAVLYYIVIKILSFAFGRLEKHLRRADAR